MRLKKKVYPLKQEMSAWPIRKCLSVCLIVLNLFCMVATGNSQTIVDATRSGSKIDVYIDGKLFTNYVVSSEEKYPYFFPVNGPSGASVTSMRNSNYPHHSSLFFGCDHVNGGNYWQEGTERGQIISLRADILKSGSEEVVIENECIWTRPGAKSPIKDIRIITISSPQKDVFQIDFNISLYMLEDVNIGRTNHSLFSGRMAADLTVINGGTMINAEGKRGEAATFGESSSWISYYGTRFGQTEGMTIMQHPSNKWYPAPWFTRDYGFFSPTPMYWPEDPDQGIFLQKGEEIVLRYRVLVHAGDHAEADIAGAFEEYSHVELR